MAFSAVAQEISADLAARMRGVSYRERLGDFIAPSLGSLRRLRLTHWDFNGAEVCGELVVAERIAARVVEVFESLHAGKYPIEKLRLIDEYGGSDEASMNDNNSSGFNCRLIDGSDRVSAHARGLAIDINPVQNPCIAAGQVQPKHAQAYADRTSTHPAVLSGNGAAVHAFLSAGFTWGGHWTEPLDYHHFQFDG